MRRFSYTLTQDEKCERTGVIYYCTASFDDAIAGDINKIEVASRKSAEAAYEICLAKARVMRMKRVNRFMPRYTIRASGVFTYTPSLHALGEYATFTAIGRSIEEVTRNTNVLALEVYEQSKETNAERIEREYGSSGLTRVKLWPNQTNTPVKPKKWSFWDWLK